MLARRRPSHMAPWSYLIKILNHRHADLVTFVNTSRMNHPTVTKQYIARFASELDRLNIRFDAIHRVF